MKARQRQNPAQGRATSFHVLKRSELSRIVGGLNPQPEPPGLNPQPEPPGLNPQPEPPGAR